jgi:hypothetical protein
MKVSKIPQNLIRLVRATLEHIKYRVKVQNNLSDASETSMDLRQKGALSCGLFNIALGKERRRPPLWSSGQSFWL